MNYFYISIYFTHHLPVTVLCNVSRETLFFSELSRYFYIYFYYLSTSISTLFIQQQGKVNKFCSGRYYLCQKYYIEQISYRLYLLSSWWILVELLSRSRGKLIRFLVFLESHLLYLLHFVVVFLVLLEPRLVFYWDIGEFIQSPSKKQ